MFFGYRFGLSFATFAFSRLSVSAVEITATDTFMAELQISSHGPAGKAVVPAPSNIRIKHPLNFAYN
jgi:hypothetical protein